MIKSLIIAVTMSLPLLAQQEAPAPQDAPPTPPQGGAIAPHGDPHHAAFMEKFDTNKDGRIDEQEKQAIRQAHEARKAEFQKKLLEKYDANKDGQLDDQEKAAIKADFEKNAQQRRHMHRRGHGPGRPSSCCNCGKRPGPHPAFMEKFDTNKDGQIDEQEKQAIRQAHEACKAEFQKKLLEKFDANKDGQLDDQEKGAIKAAMEAKRAEFMKKVMDKYDTNKDGQLDEQEKAAAKADFHPCCCSGKRRQRPCGPKHHHGVAPAPEAPPAPAE